MITDSYVLDVSTKSKQMEKLQSTGGRLPNGSNSAEMDALRARCRNSYGGTYIDGSTWKYAYYLNGNWGYKNGRGRLYIVFDDVPSL